MNWEGDPNKSVGVGEFFEKKNKRGRLLGTQQCDWGVDISRKISTEELLLWEYIFTVTPGQKAQQNNVIHFIHSNHLANWKNDLFTYFPGILEYLDNLSCKEGTTPEKINEKK